MTDWRRILQGLYKRSAQIMGTSNPDRSTLTDYMDKLSELQRTDFDENALHQAGLGSALLDATPEMAEYMTPVAGNLKGAEDFGSSLDQYLTARDADPLSALMYIPQLAGDAAQAIVPISAFTGSIRGAGNALNRTRNYITKAW